MKPHRSNSLLRRASKRLLADAIACCLFGAAAAHAGTITVTSNADSGAGSLRDAIAAAAAGDTIVFDAAGLAGGQTIALASSLTPTVDLAISGGGAPAVTLSNATGRVFDFTSTAVTAVTLDSLTLEGTASDNYTGGAIHVSTLSATFALTLTNDTVRGTLAKATRGGAISVTGFQDSLTIDQCDIAGTVLTTNTVSNNTAGGIYFASQQTLSINRSVVSGQVSGSSSGKNWGGAIYQNAGTATITNSTIAGASVVGARSLGGGITLNGGTLNLSGVTVSGNSADTAGGGIYVFQGTLNAVNTTISGNSAGTFGGGAVGAFYASNGRNGTAALNLTNTTISGNVAPTASALYVAYSPPAFSPKTSKNTVTLTNTIVSGTVARQTSGSATDANEILNATNSVFDDAPTTGAGNTVNGTNAGNLFATDPLLGPLQNNGGSTATHALGAGSPAIDAALAASCPTFDQRGFPRFGTCDVGAFENQGDRIFANGVEDGETFQ